MKRLIWLILLIPVIYGCGKSVSSNEKTVEASALFQQSEQLLRECINLYSEAKDSLTVDSINDFFEKRIVEINFSFPPETDLNLSEQDNDSIFFLMERMIQAKSTRLKELEEAYYYGSGTPPDTYGSP